MKPMYKILNPSTGEFSSGGLRPHWSKEGKIWRSLGALKNHLNLFRDYPDDARVVRFELTQVEDFAMRFYKEDIEARQAEKSAKSEENWRRAREREERRELAALLTKYPDVKRT